MVNFSAVFDELVSTTETGLLPERADVLADFSPNVVVSWYERLAMATQASYEKSRPGGTSLSAAFLMHWRDSSRTRLVNGQVVWNRSEPKSFDVATLVGNQPLREKLAREVRPVFLSERQLGNDANKGFGGAVRRLQEGWGGEPRTLTYTAGSVEGATNAVKAKVYWQLEVRHLPVDEIDWVSLDIYASLHTFAVESTVVIRATPVAGDSKRFTIHFDSWKWRILDTYDWDDPNPDKRNDMPNPDFNRAVGPFVVRPDLEYITVWHRNARRVEAANLAAPFPVESTVHTESDPDLLKSAVVRIDKNLVAGR